MVNFVLYLTVSGKVRFHVMSRLTVSHESVLCHYPFRTRDSRRPYFTPGAHLPPGNEGRGYGTEGSGRPYKKENTGEQIRQELESINFMRLKTVRNAKKNYFSPFGKLLSLF